jgi:hypothetical protein
MKLIPLLLEYVVPIILDDIGMWILECHFQELYLLLEGFKVLGIVDVHKLGTPYGLIIHDELVHLVEATCDELAQTATLAEALTSLNHLIIH